MLRDLLTGLTTPLSPHLRALGYLDEALAMRRRARQNRAAWQPHLASTRKFVLEATELCGDRERVFVLGSGLLLDVPLDELSALFEEVVLMDVVCLPEIRRQIRRYPNVRFTEHDATGVAEELMQEARNGTPVLPEPAHTASAYDSASLVVSLNILSQLWVVPRQFAAQNLRGIAPEAADDWCARVVEAHYAALRELPCDVCLVGDHAYVKRDCEGSVISRGSTVYGLALPEPEVRWTWNIVPLGRDSPHASKELLVGAWFFPRNAGRSRP